MANTSDVKLSVEGSANVTADRWPGPGRQDRLVSRTDDGTDVIGGQARRRSGDLCFFRAALYRLSYLAAELREPSPRRVLKRTGMG